MNHPMTRPRWYKAYVRMPTKTKMTRVLNGLKDTSDCRLTLERNVDNDCAPKQRFEHQWRTIGELYLPILQIIEDQRPGFEGTLSDTRNIGVSNRKTLHLWLLWAQEINIEGWVYTSKRQSTRNWSVWILDLQKDTRRMATMMNVTYKRWQWSSRQSKHSDRLDKELFQTTIVLSKMWLKQRRTKNQNSRHSPIWPLSRRTEANEVSYTLSNTPRPVLTSLRNK